MAEYQISARDIKRIVLGALVNEMDLDIKKVLQNMEGLLTDDFGADSLDAVESVMKIEEGFEEYFGDDKVLEITDDEAEKVTTPQKAIDVTTKLLRNAGVTITE